MKGCGGAGGGGDVEQEVASRNVGQVVVPSISTPPDFSNRHPDPGTIVASAIVVESSREEDGSLSIVVVTRRRRRKRPECGQHLEEEGRCRMARVVATQSQGVLVAVTACAPLDVGRAQGTPAGFGP